MKGTILQPPLGILLVIALCITSCTGHGRLAELDISVPEDMPVCPEGQATPEIPCFEGVYVDGELKDTCGRYWDIHSEDIEQAMIERSKCCDRNIEVIKYYLDLNRSQLLFIQGELAND